jgi:uncharacterized protein with LGFP repeats
LALVIMARTSASPARAAAIYTGQGFDTCAAPSASTMQAWLSSPYRAAGIYVGGANRACGDGNLSAGWVNAVQAQGWKLAPLYVGLQAPCVDQPGLATIDPGNPSGQGTQAADDAAQRAANFGMGAGTPIYFDMEAYGGGCSGTVLAFEDAWTNELHRLGLVSGVYGSLASTINDLAAHNPNSPDDIWFAAWNGDPSVETSSVLRSAYLNHQRIHQYQGGTNQSFGGVTLNIDLDFADGALTGNGGPVCQTFSSPATGSHQVCGAILSKYLSLGGAFFLGFPTTDEVATPDGVGRFNYFSNNGAIYWTPFKGAWSIHGAILDKWASMGWERSVLGYPVTDETTTPDTVGRFNYFNNDGSIYWTPGTGAWSVHGAILDKWASLGWERLLGYPVTDETTTPDTVGRFNHFNNNGSIYWTPGPGAWSIHGAVLDKWASLGWERSVLGYPVTDEIGTPDHVGRFNYFSTDGAIYWTPTTGARSMHGRILDKWASLGWERFLGYPVTDETSAANGAGRFNDLSPLGDQGKATGSIYWTPGTGAWSIHGALRAKYVALGGATSLLGFPVTDETGTPDGVGRFNHFSSSLSLAKVDGSIYWTPNTGAWSVHGAIRTQWASMGWEKSCLGYPTSDEMAMTSNQTVIGRESMFQHGDITLPLSTQLAGASCTNPATSP